MHLVDTCVVSEARTCMPEAIAWLRGAQSETLFLSVVTIGEITKGIMQKMRTDPAQAAAMMRWGDELRLAYASRTLPIADAATVIWGKLMAQRRRPMAAALIAATARGHNKIVVMRNAADFADSGEDLVDPWEV